MFDETRSWLSGLKQNIIWWLIVLALVMFGITLFLWLKLIIPNEKGLYSPFENGLSLIKYVALICGVNLAITISSLKRQKIWVVMPIAATLFILGLTLFYLITLWKLNV
ncbi:MAG: hypothetical protein WC773_02285 [Patescibacteria group bacterium]|jgi:hypothetical protein